MAQLGALKKTNKPKKHQNTYYLGRVKDLPAGGAILKTSLETLLQYIFNPLTYLRSFKAVWYSSFSHTFFSIHIK